MDGARAAARHLRIALADDAAVLRAAFAHALAGSGHEIVGSAESVAAALALYERERPDVLVVDSRLPPDGAVALVAAVLSRDPGARVLVIASLAEIEIVRRAVAGGARGAIRRPLERSDVLDALARAGA